MELHKPHTNPNDSQDFVTVQLFDKSGAKLESIHVCK